MPQERVTGDGDAGGRGRLPGVWDARTERASFPRRTAAVAVDALLIYSVFGVLEMVGVDLPGPIRFSLVALYRILLEGSPCGQTVGKRFLRIRVARAQSIAGDGPGLGFPRSSVRWAVGWISAAPLFLGYLWMLWDDNGQTWHDKASSSTVIPASLTS